MKVKQIVFCVAFIVFTINLSAQTGIGTSSPHASAKLEVNATNKGFLPPRVTLTSATDATTIATPAEGLLVYNLGSVGLKSGYYYWNSSNWATIATASSPDQTVDYVSVTRTSDLTINTNDVVKFNSIYAGTIPYDATTGKFSLTAGKTYKLSASIALSNGNTSISEASVVWKNAAGDFLPNKAEVLSSSHGTNAGGNANAVVIYTPTVNTTVNLIVAYATPNAILWGSYTYANIEQIGSSAIVNPWVLSGNDVYNTSGNVGIGTSSPTSRLNIAGGGIKMASSLGNTSTRPNLNTSTIGNYEIRGVGGGSTQIDGQDDGFLRLSAGGGTNVNTQSSIDLSGYSTVADMSNTIVMRTGGAERLRIDPNGNVNSTGKLTIGDPSGNVSTKLVGRVTAGTFLTFENLKFSVTTTGQRGLSIATVSGTVNFYVEGKYNNASNTIYGSRTDTAITYTTSPSGSLFGWGFISAGDTIIYHLTDADNSRMYRVTLIIMPSYINNFIAIERLL